MKLTITRMQWTVFDMPEGGWITILSIDSKDARDFWLMAGTWAAREIWDLTMHQWRISCVRKVK